MRQRRIFVSMVVGACALASLPEAASSAPLALVNLRGAILADTTVGGSGITQAEYEDLQTFTGSDYVQTSSGSLESDATLGLLTGSILGQVAVSGSIPRLTPFVVMRVEQIDVFTVGAGATGLSNGDPVEVRIEASLAGRIVVQGNPSGGSEVRFGVQGVPGIPGEWASFYTGGLSPPADVPFEEHDVIVVDTTVGATISLTTLLTAQLGGTSYSGGLAQNTANATALIRVSPGPGDLGLEISSQAGASTRPLRAVPLASPAALVLLVALLASTGVLLALHRRRATGSPGRSTTRW